MSGKGITTNTEEKALALLGSGTLSLEVIANTLGVETSRISQLMAREDFAAQVQELRIKNFSAHIERDKKIDAIEDDLIGRVEESINLIMRPMELIRALETVNRMKRTSVQAVEPVSAHEKIIPLQLPQVVINKFTTNIQNQVVQAGNQSLVTIGSSALMEKLKTRNAKKQEVQEIQKQELLLENTEAEIDNDSLEHSHEYEGTSELLVERAGI